MSQAADADSEDCLNRGQQLCFRYRIQTKLGEGGMGQIYLAVDERMQREVAIKLLHPGISQAGAEILKAEAITTAALDHRDIVKVYDIEQIPAAPGIPKRLHGTFFMVLEYVPGTTLYCQLRDHGRSSVPQQTVQIWRELVAAIAFAHERNVIHRDLKPGNIIVQRQGLKVLDFGIAKACERLDALHDPPLLCSPCGTPCYMRPAVLEAFENNRRIAPDKRDDVYALGVIFYQMLTGELCHPLEHNGQRQQTYLELADSLPFPDTSLRKECNSLIVAALGLDPKKDLADANQLLSECDALLSRWYEYRRTEQERASRSKQERSLDIQRQAYLRHRRTLVSQHRRARRLWLLGTLAITGFLFWGSIFVFVTYRQQRDYQDLLALCQGARKEIRSEPRFQPRQMEDILARTNQQLIRDRRVPQVCVELLYLDYLESRGLLRESATVAAEPELLSEANDWLRRNLKDVRSWTVAPDFKTVAGGSGDGQILTGRSYDNGLRPLSSAPRELIPKSSYPIQTALSPDARWLAAAYDSGHTIFRYRLALSQDVSRWSIGNEKVSSVSVLLDGALLIGTSSGQVWRSDDSSPQKGVRLLLPDTKAPVLHTALLDSSTMLVITKGWISLWDLRTKERQLHLSMTVEGILHYQLKAPQLVLRAGDHWLRWQVDGANLAALGTELGSACTLPELLPPAAATRAIDSYSLKQSSEPWPSVSDPHKCLAVVCQRLHKDRSVNSTLGVVCQQLAKQTRVPFLDRWNLQ